jgi:anaerobic selenocysteine-containing dehydrogenase
VTTVTYCRICSAYCGLLLDVEDNRVVRVLGDPDHPLSGGYTCAKGRRIGDFAADPARFRTAHRRGPSGDLEPVDTPTAVAEVGAALRGIVERHGVDAVAMWTGTQAALTNLSLPAAFAFWNALGSRKRFSPMTIDQAPKWLTPARLGQWLGGRQSFDESDVWIFAGHNPLVSMMGGWITGFPQQNGRRRLRDAKRRGMKVVVIDPRRTETASLADLHLQLVPGTDAVLFAGLLHVIFRDGLEDRRFCERWADSVDELREAVESATPERVAARTGLRPAEVEEAARLFGTASKGMLSTGTGSNMGPFGNLNEHLAWCVNIVCGRWAREGDAVYPPRVLRPADAPREGVAPPLRDWAGDYRSRVRGGATHFYGELPVVVMADEILEPGDDRVRALIVVGGNPASVSPDQGRMVEALSQLELLVTVEPFPNETARLAHYVLPPALALERREHTGFMEASVGHPFAQFTDAVLEPPEGVREDWEYMFALARELRLELTLFGRTYAPDDPPPTVDELLEAGIAGGRVPLDDVKGHAHGRLFDDLPPVRVGPPQGNGDGARFQLLPPDVAEELAAALAEAPADTRPYSLVVRRALEVSNTTGRRIPGLPKRRYNPCFVNPDDLAELGLARGDTVLLTSDHGSVAAVVDPDPTLRPGVVSMTHAFGDLPGSDADPRAYGTNPARLVSADDEIQPYTGMPRLTALPVSIEPLATGEPGAP